MTVKVEYFTIEGAPGKYFHCEPYDATVSTAACAALYLDEKAHPGTHPACRGCPIGAMHAGEKLPTARTLYKSKICPRCLRPSTRFVKGLCISCINRQYEVERGRNARGKPPVKLQPLAPMAMALREDGRVVIAKVDLSSSLVEIILRALRTRPDVRAFGRRSSSSRFIARFAGDLFSPPVVRL